MLNLFKRLVREEEGQGLVEYALILVLIAVAAIVVMRPLGEKIAEIFTDVETELDGGLPDEG